MPNISNNIFDAIVDKENLYSAYNKTLKGKEKYTTEAMLFAQDEVYNLKKLRESLINQTYEFDDYIRFFVFEPKERLIDAPHFKDKVVQLAMNNILKDIYNLSFIYDSYSCIDEKGTHACANRIQEFMQRGKWEYGESTYIIKGDVKKFFYSINRNILKKLLSKKIKCPLTFDLYCKIIDSADKISPLGLPLGNTLSQLSANIYLNELDQYCKRKLSIKYYVRYMDDFFIICESKDKAKQLLSFIDKFVEEKLQLELNKNKTQIFPINQGVNAIGFKIYTTHMLLRNNCKQKIKRKVKAMPYLIMDNKVTIRKAEQMLNSWKNHADYADSYNFINKLIEKHDFIDIVKINKKSIFKINIDKLSIIIKQIISRQYIK